MLAYCVYVLKVASTEGLMPFLVACHCTILLLIFCFVMYLVNIFLSLFHSISNTMTKLETPDITFKQVLSSTAYLLIHFAVNYYTT